MNPSYLHTLTNGQKHIQLFIPTAPLQVEKPEELNPHSISQELAQPNKCVQQDSQSDFYTEVTAPNGLHMVAASPH